MFLITLQLTLNEQLKWNKSRYYMYFKTIFKVTQVGVRKGHDIDNFNEMRIYNSKMYSH